MCDQRVADRLTELFVPLSYQGDRQVFVLMVAVHQIL
jgi:hypothetical protein